VSVLETYGMTEAASQVTANPLDRARGRAGSAGLPRGPGLRVVDELGVLCPPGVTGSVEIRGPEVVGHYLEGCPSNAKAGLAIEFLPERLALLGRHVEGLTRVSLNE